MYRRLLPAFAGVALAAIPAAAQRSCESLTQLALPNVTISLATPVSAGQFTPPGAGAGVEVPAFCRVAGVVAPEIRFELWMPVQWNRKLLAVGNGGLPADAVPVAKDAPKTLASSPGASGIA